MVYCLGRNPEKKSGNSTPQDEFNVVQNFFGVASSPVIYDDLLLLMVGGSPADAPAIPPGQLDRVQPDGSGIVALDKFSGAIRYQTANELASYSSIKLFQHREETLAFAWLRGSLVGFFPETGDVVSGLSLA